MSGITVYEKRTCTTCRRLAALLTERGIDFERVDYFVEPLGEEQLRSLLAKAGLRPRDVVRMKEPDARELSLDDDEATLRALVERPDLLQRPIIERGDRAVLGRPPENVLELLD
ncbi:MAG: arsenate reductase family protein [Solirubrobacteraceae bacterium]